MKSNLVRVKQYVSDEVFAGFHRDALINLEDIQSVTFKSVSRRSDQHVEIRFTNGETIIALGTMDNFYNE